MDEKEELKQELEWVQYRQKMLDIIEEKLFQMKQLAEQAKQKNRIWEDTRMSIGGCRNSCWCSFCTLINYV